MLTVIFFVQFLIRLLAGPLLPAIENDLSLSHSQSGIFILLIGMGIFFSQLVAPNMAAKFGFRRCITLSLIGASLAALIIGFSRSIWSIDAGYIFLGFTAGLYAPSGISLIMVLVDSRDWGKAMGIHEIAPNLALIFAPVLATATVGLGSWRQGYLYLSIIIALLWVFHMMWGIDSIERPMPPDFSILKKLVVKSSFWKTSALLSLAVGIETGVYSMTPLFFVNERNFSLVDANHLLSMSRIPCLLMVILSGWLTDRFSASKMVRISFALTGISVFLLGVCPRDYLELILYLQAAFSACLFPPLLSIISKITTSANRVLMLSLTLAIAPVVGGGIFPALIAIIGDYGTFSSGFICVGILSMAGIFMLPASKETENYNSIK